MSCSATARTHWWVRQHFRRLYGVVRQVSKRRANKVKHDIVGGSIEMDRGVLDRMARRRSSIAAQLGPGHRHPRRLRRHERLQVKGPPRGTTAIQIIQEANVSGGIPGVTEVACRSGRSLSVPARKGLLGADATISEADTANLIFRAGFSTAAEQVAELLRVAEFGMDVVRARSQRLGRPK